MYQIAAADAADFFASLLFFLNFPLTYRTKIFKLHNYKPIQVYLTNSSARFTIRFAFALWDDDFSINSILIYSLLKNKNSLNLWNIFKFLHKFDLIKSKPIKEGKKSRNREGGVNHIGILYLIVCFKY